MDRADAFEAMLVERGIAELQHPTYGTVKVVPTGHIEREDDPVDKFGESTVKITFTETITDEDSAELNEVAASEIEEELDEFSEAAAADFAEAIVTEDTDLQADITANLEEQTGSIIDDLQYLAEIDTKSLVKWLSAVKELKDKIKNLYKKAMDVVDTVESVYTTALDIARLTLWVVKLPSAIAVSISEKIKGYSKLTEHLINQYKNDPFGINKIKAAYATAALALTGACASIASGTALTIAEVAETKGATSAASRGIGSGSSIDSGGANPASANKSAGVSSREDAIEAANKIAEFLETVAVFQDAKIEQDVFIDAAPTAHIALASLVSSSIQLILNASFALPMQKTITLDRDRQALELCAELYGTTDRVDDFIIGNNFNINEIELLPMGKKVSYYVQSA
jgi:hypothetical protein